MSAKSEELRLAWEVAYEVDAAARAKVDACEAALRLAMDEWDAAKDARRRAYDAWGKAERQEAE